MSSFGCCRQWRRDGTSGRVPEAPDMAGFAGERLARPGASQTLAFCHQHAQGEEDAPPAPAYDNQVGGTLAKLRCARKPHALSSAPLLNDITARGTEQLEQSLRANSLA
eukprot:2953183-Pleurochrysis_carterae.AAC.1